MSSHCLCVIVSNIGLYQFRHLSPREPFWFVSVKEFFILLNVSNFDFSQYNLNFSVESIDFSQCTQLSVFFTVIVMFPVLL